MDKCGIVDIGSNTVQLSVHQYKGSSFQLLLNRWETVGLMGYVADGTLNADGVAVLCRVLADFQSLLNALHIPALHVFATASLRNIGNTDAVVADICGRTGIPVEILSGEEEANLSFRGAMLARPSPAGLMVDIGGGSTELVEYRDGAVTSARSLPMGALFLYKKYVDFLFPTSDELRDIHAHITDKLGAGNARQEQVVGVGGTIRAVVRLCNLISKANVDNHTVPVGQVHSLYSLLSAGDKHTLDLLLKVVPERVHTLIPGLMILSCVLTAVDAHTLTVSESGVREGYLMDKVIR